MNKDTKQETQRKPDRIKNYGLIGNGVILPVTRIEGERLEQGNGSWMYSRKEIETARR